MVEQFRLFVDDGRERAPVDWEQQRQNPRRPAVNVTWHTACAYCEWLSRKTGDRVRLPTEEEWEFAARGPKSRKYPWGEEKPDPTRANYSETKIGAPSPVGQFPKGNTPEGVSDMAGNVWEWTSSDWSTAGKVVRGASFDNGAWRLRAACRIWWSPVYGFGIFGFRCVREVSP
jgi:formylglycine-generating enzyme required for sulfatase activity